MKNIVKLKEKRKIHKLLCTCQNKEIFKKYVITKKEVNKTVSEVKNEAIK